MHSRFILSRCFGLYVTSTRRRLIEIMMVTHIMSIRENNKKVPGQCSILSVVENSKQFPVELHISNTRTK
jgi:hypothetical protein